MTLPTGKDRPEVVSSGEHFGGAWFGRPAAASAPAPLFLLDKTLGRLARWLRVLGYDAVWDAVSSPWDLLRRADAEGRVILTRDTLLVQRREVRRGVVRALLVHDDHLVDQLRQLRVELGLRRRGDPRCMVCNGVLEVMRQEEVQGRVPLYVAATECDFRYCRACNRITWPATHWEGMMRILEQAGLP
jgi:uncharacterized protein with PIN domain